MRPVPEPYLLTPRRSSFYRYSRGQQLTLGLLAGYEVTEKSRNLQTFAIVKKSERPQDAQDADGI